MLDGVKVSFVYPPNYGAIRRAFKIGGRSGLLFAYAPVIYNPSAQTIRRDFYEHELVHIRQQGDDPAGWWERYIADREFRLGQEVEAYRHQLAFARNGFDVASYGELLDHVVKTLCGPIYGRMVSHQQAQELLLRA